MKRIVMVLAALLMAGAVWCGNSYFVVIGSFANRDNAVRFVENQASEYFEAFQIWQCKVKGETMYRVAIVKPNREEAEQEVQFIKENFSAKVWITPLEGSNKKVYDSGNILW